jgi:FdhD protein
MNDRARQFQPPTPTAGASPAQVVRWRDAAAATHSDWLAEEVPVALVFNGISHAVMLCSPTDLEDLALGFALAEGIVQTAQQVFGIEVHTAANNMGIELQLHIAAANQALLKERRRSLAGRTGCGLCGTDSLAQLQRNAPQVPTQHIQAAAIAHAQRCLAQQQPLQQLTGAVHAAAWCSTAGDLLSVREDIGRHNALDKLLGALHHQGITSRDGFVCITSRASYEMVQKAAVLGTGVLAAVSAPTALAVKTAQDCNLALAGFTRADNLVAYTFAERFGLN